MRLPYVIDNRSDDTSLRHVLRGLLAEHSGKSIDVATAFFSLRGFELLADLLAGLGSFRLLLGAEPRSGVDIGIHLDPRASQIRLEDLGCDPLSPQVDAALLRRELERAPLDEPTQLLVEALIRFLQNEWVEVRRYGKGFLHAKTWLFYADRVRSGQGILLDRFQPLLGIVGSSNFTGPGLTGNNELNLSHQVLLDAKVALDPEAAGMVGYLGQEAASSRISDKNRQLIKSEVGARAIQQLVDWFDDVWEESVDYKSAFIRVLMESKYGETEYTPYQIYLKALWHYFRDELDDKPADRATVVELTEFQEDAVKRARRILARYNGVLVADSVGLGKTWIGKRLLEEWGYFQRQQVLVIAPASLARMWDRELRSANISAQVITQEIMGQPQFDPSEYGSVDVILIDESHNFCNHRSNRYEALEQLIACNGGRGQAGDRKKIILVTATPINNDVYDLYSQFNLITQGDDGHFASAGIGDMRRYFAAARKAAGRNAGANLFNILEQVAVRRPRSFIRENYPEATIGGKLIKWPDRKLHTQHYSLAEIYGRDFFHSIVERIEALRLAPFDLESYRLDPEQVDGMQLGRGRALVGIFKCLYLKRFESSAEAFRISIDRARKFQQAYMQQLRKGRLLRSKDFRRMQALEAELGDHENDVSVEDLLAGLDTVPLDEYDIERIESEVESDLQTLSEVYGAVSSITADRDAKLQHLRDILKGELKGKKVIVFTYYKDTSRYLYDCLRKDDELLEEMGHPNVRVADSGNKAQERERIVEHFAPCSNKIEGIAGTDREIDVLVSTDVLAEGRNLQDCQYLINYDLHWAPTRLVQRTGRIDRIGTEFDTLHIHNFFPESGLDELLGLVATLTGKIETIDAQGLHDVSVLGEVPHPRAFNQIKRVEDEDDEVIAEEEEIMELASAEGLRLQLQKALESGQRAIVEGLPDGIHSARAFQNERGVFFCFEAHSDAPEKRQPFWLYWDQNTGRFEDNVYRIVQLIACNPDEPRATTADTVYDLLPQAMAHIVDASQRTRAIQDAQTKVAPEQTAVRAVLIERAAQAGVERQRLLACIQFLNQPMFRFAVRKLRELHSAHKADGDVVALLDGVDDLRLRFQKQESDSLSRTSDPISSDDLHLVCFEYVV